MNLFRQTTCPSASWWSGCLVVASGLMCQSHTPIRVRIRKLSDSTGRIRDGAPVYAAKSLVTLLALVIEIPSPPFELARPQLSQLNVLRAEDSRFCRKYKGQSAKAPSDNQNIFPGRGCLDTTLVDFPPASAKYLAVRRIAIHQSRTFT